jgi:hypothetical protein
MDIVVLLVEETEEWRDDIAQEAGRIFSVYIVNRGLRVHACSMARSVEALYVETFAQNSDVHLGGSYLREPVAYFPEYMVAADSKEIERSELQNGWYPLEFDWESIPERKRDRLVEEIGSKERAAAEAAWEAIREGGL